MGLNKASDFQAAYVAFIEQLAKDPKTPRFGGAKITSPSPLSLSLVSSSLTSRHTINPHLVFFRRGPGGQVDPGADGVAPAVSASRQEGLHPALHAQERQPAQRPAQALEVCPS